MDLSKMIFETVKKNLKGLEKRCQSMVTVTVTHKKRKINCIMSQLNLINLILKEETNHKIQN